MNTKKLTDIAKSDKIRVLRVEDGDDSTRVCYVTFILDMSGSMSKFQKEVYQAVTATVNALATKVNEDVDCLVKIVFFNDGVYELNTEFMPPELLSEIFTEDTYRCSGCTNLSAVVNWIDKSFTRSSKMLENLRPHDPKTFTAVITDFCGTDLEADRERAMDTLKDNRLFKDYNTCLCIFCGPDDKKKDAVALCGNEGNIIALSGSDFSEYLTPVLIGSTVNLTDGTHVNHHNGEQELSPSKTATEKLERSESGKRGAAYLTNEEIKKKFDEIFKT